MSEVLLTSEAAERLRVTEGTVCRYCRQGRLPACRIGRKLLIPAAAVSQILSPATRQPEPAPAG
jgi:excisionase family DNA binding protein